MDILTIITLLIIVSTGFSYLNERVVKLPGSIGVIVISVFVSVLILIAGKFGKSFGAPIKELTENIDFSKVLLDVMLGFLLFASALHFDYRKLREQIRPVLVLSTVGVLISTGVFGGLLFLVTDLMGLHIPFLYCLVFGSLISPTDPIAVSAILKKTKIPQKLNTIISGESLFNDATGLLLFVTLLGLADSSESSFSFGETLGRFGQEVGGGIAIGLFFGFLGARLIHSIRDMQTILLISISVVLAVSSTAHLIHASVPLGVVAAGLLLGNQTFDEDNPASRYLTEIWQLLDEVLNTILFVMIGLQLVVLPFLQHYWIIGLVSIVLVLVARFFSILLPVLPRLNQHNFGNIKILTWAGLRGGISVAMALSLPESDYREVILAGCYFIVIFSIIVQGLTLDKVIARVLEKGNDRELFSVRRLRENRKIRREN